MITIYIQCSINCHHTRVCQRLLRHPQLLRGDNSNSSTRPPFTRLISVRIIILWKSYIRITPTYIMFSILSNLHHILRILTISFFCILSTSNILQKKTILAKYFQAELLNHSVTRRTSICRRCNIITTNIRFDPPLKVYGVVSHTLWALEITNLGINDMQDFNLNPIYRLVYPFPLISCIPRMNFKITKNTLKVV